jgi:hypothetical protein
LPNLCATRTHRFGMVFVWSNLVEGESNFTLSQVALNDTIMIEAFAPIVGMLLGLSSIAVPWDTLLLSVILYIVVLVIAGQLWRPSLLGNGRAPALAGVLRTLGPISLASLLLTLVLLFGLQGQQIVAQPLVILLLAVPILGQVYFNAGLAYVAEPAAGRRVVRGSAVRAHQRLELLRAGGRHRHRAVRLPVPRRAGHGRGRPGRGAGDADRDAPDAPEPPMVLG